jgi:hypothetical protein
VIRAGEMAIKPNPAPQRRRSSRRFAWRRHCWPRVHPRPRPVRARSGRYLPVEEQPCRAESFRRHGGAWCRMPRLFNSVNTQATQAWQATLAWRDRDLRATPSSDR